jgi:hypothetical protein
MHDIYDVSKLAMTLLMHRLGKSACYWPGLSCPYFKNESLLFFMPSKAKAAWVHRTKLYGLNRFLSPQH